MAETPIPPGYTPGKKITPVELWEAVSAAKAFCLDILNPQKAKDCDTIRAGAQGVLDKINALEP